MVGPPRAENHLPGGHIFKVFLASPKKPLLVLTGRISHEAAALEAIG